MRPPIEAVLEADQQVLMQTQEKLGQAITNLKVAQTASQDVSIAKAKAQAADPDYGEPVTIGTGSTQT